VSAESFNEFMKAELDWAWKNLPPEPQVIMVPTRTLEVARFIASKIRRGWSWRRVKKALLKAGLCG